MTGSQAAELDAPIPARKAGRGGEQQPSTGLTQETEWQPDWRQNWVYATTAPLLVRPTLRHAGVVLVVVMTGGTRPFEAFPPFFDEVFRFFIFVFIFVEVGRSVAGGVVVRQDRLLLSVLQAADPAICATLEGWADRQVLLVCELHRRAQQVVNSDGVQEMLDCLSGDLRAIVVALLVDLGRPGCAKPVCWDGIEPLLVSFAVTDKVEGVHGELVSLLM